MTERNSESGCKVITDKKIGGEIRLGPKEFGVKFVAEWKKSKSQEENC